MTATLTLSDICELDPLQVQAAYALQSSKGRDHYPDVVLDAVRALTGEAPMPYLAPARKYVKRELGLIPWGKVHNYRDPTAERALRNHLRRKIWRAALAEHLPDTIPARALDNLAILCAS